MSCVSLRSVLRYDYVSIFDGNSTDAFRLGRFHGGELPGAVNGSGSIVVVQ